MKKKPKTKKITAKLLKTAIKKVPIELLKTSLRKLCKIRGYGKVQLYSKGAYISGVIVGGKQINTYNSIECDMTSVKNNGVWRIIVVKVKNHQPPIYAAYYHKV